MNITKTQTINPGTEEGNKPDAVRVEIESVTVLVNLHTGVVTINGSDHVNAEEGENNTLEIHACPVMPASIEQMLDGLKMGDLAPGLQVGVMGGFSGLNGLIAGMPGFRTS